MSKISEISKTLYVPLGGRIYASEYFPDLFYDAKAIELKNRIPQDILNYKLQSQYTFLASVSRCITIDNIINSFLEQNPTGNIIELGCGLETTYFRVDNGLAKWFELDLPEVIELREQLIPCQERMTYLKESVFNPDWINRLSSELNKQPTLFVASGLFQYFAEPLIIELLHDLKRFQNSYIVFDAVSKAGMKRTRKYMKKLGRESASMYFYCDQAVDLVEKLGGSSELIFEKNFFQGINKKGMNLVTKISMLVSDMFQMLKIIELKLS